MSQPLSLDKCFKRTQTNENEIEQSLEIVEQKKANIEKKSKALKNEVESLKLEKLLLDKKIACIDLANFETEKEISVLKDKNKKVQYSLATVRWKKYKLELLKEYENEEFGIVKKKAMIEYKQNNETTSPTAVENTANMDKHLNKEEDHDRMKILKEEVKDLKEKVEAKERAIQMTDPKLYTDIQMLKKRNAALLLRYQRQVEEAESRHRQAVCYLHSLQKRLADSNALLSQQDES